MISLLIAVSVAVLTFGSGILGLYLQRRLPKEHMSGGSRDMILAVIGLVTLLLALVLGTIVGNSYAFFAAQKSGLETFASRALMVDQALAEYGPEAKAGARPAERGAGPELRAVLARARTLTPEAQVEEALVRWRAIPTSFNARPATPGAKGGARRRQTQHGAAGADPAADVLQLVSPLASSLLIVVVLWSMFLFLGFGVLSGSNTTTIVALAMGAISVASAVYLIQRPQRALFRRLSRFAGGARADDRGDRQIAGGLPRRLRESNGIVTNLAPSRAPPHACASAAVRKKEQQP